MQHTATPAPAAAKKRAPVAASGVAASVEEQSLKLVALCAAPSTEETLKLALDYVRSLGATPALISLTRAGQTIEIEGDADTAGVRRDFDQRDLSVTLRITCVLPMGPDVQGKVEAAARVAAARAEICSRGLWKMDGREPDTAASAARNGGMVGDGAHARALDEEIARAARSGHSVLIIGESGTGKTTAAARIHQTGARREGPFVTVNCAAIPEQLLEAELFGYEKGAFTGAAATKKGLFEAAEGGTLFLDEIGELTAPMQAKLLKAIEEKNVRRLGSTRDIRCDVRIITATSQPLPAKIAAGSFREDLYYRLAVLELRTASLRERRADIPALLSHRLREEQRLAGRTEAFEIEETAVEALCAYDWPGNIRQLQNIVARLTSFVEDTAAVTVEDVLRCLPPPDHRPENAGGERESVEPVVQYGDQILLPEDVRTIRPDETLNSYFARVAMHAIRISLDSTDNHVATAANRLGMTPEGLRKKLKTSTLKIGGGEHRAAPAANAA